MNISLCYILEIICSTGYKISEVAYEMQEDAEKYALSLVKGKKFVTSQASDGEVTIIVCDDTIYRIRSMIVRKGETDGNQSK